jgi:mono/diheme cytochrome c family protein
MDRNISRSATWALPSAIVALCMLRLAPAPGDEGAKLPAPAKRAVDFARDIQPIFAKHCLSCHGSEKQLSGLRLDREGDALRGGDTGVAWRAGKSDESLLIKYVAGLDPDVVMPPEGDKLDDNQIGLLRAWIDQGARWAVDNTPSSTVAKSDHWSFQPIVLLGEPPVKQTEWVRTPIDRFILARLESEGIAPAPEADRPTLIRRLSLDLLGLPPTPAEVDAFVGDDRPDAYEALVDRLLASSHFGERWGRHWLDLARYADSDGYEKDSPRPHAWRYRQWVIEAVNRDLPFDQFTIEQLAGDLLPDATIEQKVATGFHRNTLTNREGGVDQEEFRVSAVVDRVNTTASVWLGLTLGCAQCHSHKYDPLSLREYYGMFGFFNQGQEVDLPAALPREAEAYAKAKAAHDTAHAPFEKNELPARRQAWERNLDLSALAEWRPLEAESITSTGGVKFARQTDGSYLATGESPPADTYAFTVKDELTGVTALRLEVLADKSLGAQGPGRAGHGNFVLSEVRVARHEGNAAPVAVALQSPWADFSQEKYPIAAAIDGDPKTGWAVSPQFGRRHVAHFDIGGDLNAPGGTLVITLVQEHGAQHTIGRFRLSVTGAARPIGGETLPDEILSIVKRPSAERTADERAALDTWYRSIDPELARLRQAEIEHARQAPAPPATLAQTLAEVSPARKTHIHLRGDFLRKGDEVAPHTPGVLPPLKGTPGRSLQRLDLARWLVSPANPLTPRVTMNRVWKHLFGQALVSSMDDFGTRGEKPSHPELLDWLAGRFTTPPEGEVPWSIKRMIRLIVRSSTYRQASRPRAELLERDPKNTLLARQNRFRVEAEVLRDLYLASSGLLHPAIGGPSVRPRQPAGIAELTYAGSARWVESTGADRYRRGLYTWFQRTSPYPMLMTFDAPDSNVTCTRRERSNTPLQALTLLNDPVFHECAQALGRRMFQHQPGDVAARLQLGFRLCVGRVPTPEELDQLRELAREFRSAAAADPSSAARLAGEPKPAETDLPDVAAEIAVARILLNLDEFVTRE